MSNAHEHRAAARRLRQMAAQLVDDTRSLGAAFDPRYVAGGPVRWALERALADVGTSVHRAAIDLDRLAAICEHRAEADDRTFLRDTIHLLRDRATATGAASASRLPP